MSESARDIGSSEAVGPDMRAVAEALVAALLRRIERQRCEPDIWESWHLVRALQALERNKHREAIAWTTLGLALAQDGRPEAAINAHTRSQELFQAAGDRHREGIASNNLGSALMQAGQVEKAVESYCRALEIYQEFEDWYRTGRTLENLARAHLAAGARGQSHQCWLRAGQAFTQADAPDRAASAIAEADAIVAPAPGRIPTAVGALDPAPKAVPAETGWGYPHGPLPLPPFPGGPWAISGPSSDLPLDRAAQREPSAQSSGDQEVEHQHGS